MPDHLGHRSWTEALVGDGEALRAPDGEGGDHLEGEGRGVIVIDEHDDVRPVFGKTHVGPFVSGEDRAPVVVAGLAEVQSRADRRNVAGGNASSDARHGSFPSLIERTPMGERPPATIIAVYSSTVMPVIDAAACTKLLPSVAKILARK